MYRIILLLVFLSGLNVSFAQYVSLNELMSLCKQKNWEDVDRVLSSKKWMYFKSKEGNSSSYNKITWTYNKNDYNDRAEGWFYIFTYEGLPNKISYLIFSEEINNKIRQSIPKAGFKLSDSQIKDNLLISEYQNKSYILKVKTKKNLDDDDYGLHMNRHTYTLILKSGIYDPDNGKKKEYYYGGSTIQKEYTLKNGKYHGKYTSYYYNGNIKKTGTYSNGDENGTFKEYYKNGILKREYIAKNNLRNGIQKEFHEDGYISFKANFKNDKLNGETLIYFKNGKIKIHKFFKDGKQYGLTKEYYENGQLSYEYTMKNEVIVGKWTSYFENGNIHQKGNLTNGRSNGYFENYNIDGDLVAKYSLKDSLLTDSVFQYTDTTFSAEFFVNGKKEGVGKYYKHNVLIASVSYSNDKRDGLLQLFRDSILVEEKRYKDGELHGAFMNQEKIDSTRYFINRGEFYLGEKHGTWTNTLYQSNEKIGVLREINYDNGVLSGSYKEALADSIVTANYRYGKLHGEYKVYKDMLAHLTGGFTKLSQIGTELVFLEKEGFYTSGQKNSTWKYYNEYDELIRKASYSNGLKDGTFKYYYPSTIPGLKHLKGKCRLIQNFRKGKLHGEHKTTSYLDGEIYPCTVEGKADSCVRYWEIKEEITSNYKDGVYHGFAQRKDTLGHIVYQGNHYEGKKDGEWLLLYTYNDVVTGEKQYSYDKGHFKNDLKQGKWIQYPIDNPYLINTEIHYKDGKYHGTYTQFNLENKPLEIRTFDNDNLRRVDDYDSTGTYVEFRWDVSNETESNYRCNWTKYWDDSTLVDGYFVKKNEALDPIYFKLQFLYSLADGVNLGYKDGTHTLSYKGELLEEGQWSKNERNGVWKFFFKAQDCILHIDYNDNERDYYKDFLGQPFSGKLTIINHGLKIKEVRKVKEGFRNGKTIFYNLETNKVIRKEKYKDGLLKE